MAAALPAWAQLGSGNPAREPSTPYTVEFKITHVQTLASGGTITRESKEVMMRDSEGRTLRTTTQIPDRPDQPEVTFSYLTDPVERTHTAWESRSKQVRVTKMPAPGERQGCWSNNTGNMNLSYGSGDSVATGGGGGGGIVGAGSGVAAVPPTPLDGLPAVGPRPASIRPEREDLGTDTILGVEVHGTRYTYTVPAGQEGNDVPLVTTSENWMAPGLGLTLRTISDSPQSGRTTREAVSLDLSEPDPAAFQPPEGYEVITDDPHPVACQQGR
jgi:hypothetical protein